MHNEFMAITEKDGDWFIAYCLEIPGAMDKAVLKKNAYRVCLMRSI